MDPSISSTISIDLTNSAENFSDRNSVVKNLSNFKTDNVKDICIKTEVTTNSASVISAQVPSVQSKSQVLPTVYFQIPATVNKNNANNMILNLSSNITNLNGKSNNLAQGIGLPTNLGVSPNQGVILAKSQQIMIQKSPSNIQSMPVMPVTAPTTSVSKNTVAYLTMLHPMAKQSDQTNRIQQNSMNKLKTENVHILPKTTANSNSSQKFVIAPMPKITSNRLPVTATTNCVQSKIAFMPLTIPNHINTSTSTPNQKVFNLKISEGQLNKDNAPLSVMCDSTASDKEETTIEIKEDECNTLICNEIIDLDSPQKKSPESTEDKSYQLSIVEDSSSSRNDVSFTITIPNDSEKNKQELTQNETPKFTKHGVSILKKSFNLLDRKPDKGKSSLIISPVPNLITTISDANTKEVKITASSSLENDESIVTRPSFKQKTERRRKSHFAYRKDYDEIEVTSTVDWDNKQSKFDDANVTLTKLIHCESRPKNETKVIEDQVEIEVVKDKTDVNMGEDFDVSKILSWEDEIGTLPGSDLKFQMNEFGLLEYLTADEYKKIIDKKTVKPKDKDNKLKNEEEYQCNECGCYGLSSEFINPKYCSYACQEAGEKNKEKGPKVKKKRKRGYYKKTEVSNEVIKQDHESTPSEEENTSNENSQDKYNYPWNCTKKGFSWAKYLEHIKAKAAPVKLFKDAFPYTRNGFRPGMKLEGIDPQHPSYFCVLTVAEVIGYRLRLHFDGFPDNYDYWVNADSMDIFPAGWCEKYGHTLRPPSGHLSQEFNWTNYLKQTRSTAAPKHLFANRAGNSICPNGFRVGMKLEAVDRKNTSLVCVATITDMMDNRILVHFDSWDDIYDYWADPSSPYIHPVGWCDQYGHNLTPPNGYPNPETFTWERYLKETKSTAAPVRAFKQRPANGFKRGMRLECVDKRVPQLIRAATIDDVREHQIRISFDGWPDRYSYWVDDDSNDIHPVTWCQKTGHPLEPPLTPDDVYDFLECPTVGCRGIGHIRGPKHSIHSLPKHCPYAEENIDLEKILPDRFLSPDRQIESAMPVQREPRDKIKSVRAGPGRPPKIPRLDPLPEIKTEWIPEGPEDISCDVKPEIKCKKIKLESPELIKTEPNVNGYTNLEQQQAWRKHSKYLIEFIKNESDPQLWSEDEVSEFVTSLPNCQDHGALFNKHKIDGESLLMLSQSDLVDILKIKLGPAIKLYNCILLLRQNIAKGYT